VGGAGLKIKVDRTVNSALNRVVQQLERFEMTELRGYAKSISEATGVTDPADLTEIETWMREEHRTLDHLDRARFNRLARESWGIVQYLRTPAGQAEWEAAGAAVMGCA
jgi:hypothetical protein